MKKVIALLLSFALLASLTAFAETGSTVSYPLDTDKTLTMYLASGLEKNDSYQDYNDWPFLKYLEENTGVHVQYSAPVEGANATQAFNLLLSSGDLPDMIYMGGLPGQCSELIEDGYIITLTDYMEEYAPTLYSILKADDVRDKSLKTDDGDYYAFPFLREDVAKLGTYVGIVVNTKLLDEVGMEMPVTIEDWDTMLYAIKDICDVPLGGNSLGRLKGMFSSAFGFNGFDTYYIDDEGKVKTWMNAEGLRDELTLLSRWMADGIIDPDIITIDGSTFYQKMAAQVYGASYFGYGSVQGFIDPVTERDNGYFFKGVPYPVMNEGDEIRYLQGEAAWIGIGAVITTACEDVELAMRWLDYSYTDEGIMTWNYGKEGESYEIVDGMPQYTALITEANEPLRQATSRYVGINGNGFSVMQVYFDSIRNPKEGTELVDVWTKDTENAVRYRMPTITATVEETEELADLETALTSYANESFINFLIGAESMDNFDQYLADLEKLNIERVLEIKQAQYDRYLNR